MTTDEASELAKDLRAIARGDLTEVAFNAKYKGADTPALRAVWHGLQHYFADADIRAKDPEYRRMQEQQFERLVELLESDASGDALRAVTFLGQPQR